MPMKLYWSHRLEALAERLFLDAEALRGDDPFARSCVVVGHSLRGDWLREFHLFDRRNPVKTRSIETILRNFWRNPAKVR